MKKTEKVIEAIEYFYTQGFIEELTTDKKYYTEILIDFAAEKLNITIEL